MIGPCDPQGMAIYGDYRRLATERLSPITECLNEAFARIDETVEYYCKFDGEGSRGRVCALTTIKCRYLVMACHSLALDGLSQESGAILRPLIEGIELLKYFRDITGAIDEAMENRLPNPGMRAKLIGGVFKFLRDHLNENASHFAVSHYSMAHLFDF